MAVEHCGQCLLVRIALRTDLTHCGQVTPQGHIDLGQH